ncbi:Hypothetical predicted protein [Olea europaea subsp. europaea]|uniref:Uncharacterized protein n=1 Tax=Olea europaea subsp. europaea TaxID=158383 RepID=A0A8S0PTQ3_OLEEU|nr:Hypothetical predicted protein [Olea europaea subsp. europaea]
MSMEEILKNIYSDYDSFVVENNGIGVGDAVVDASDAGGGMRNGCGDGDGNRTMDEVWREIVIGGGSGGAVGEPAMTLKDFFTKAGRVDATMNSVLDVEAVEQFGSVVHMQNGSTGEGYGMRLGNGMVVVGRSGGLSHVDGKMKGTDTA